ncbi:MAG: helix-turn-helix transcriptional regulator, partial [Erysipelotrichia bacterium]|nr:helix-turn-helix transcriptional regulator [Erysipelotrichia bacterium]
MLLTEADQQSQPEKILIAAFEVISSKGYANVSTRDIADKAGVVLSQLNYYFKNKEGLFKEVVRMMVDKYL